MISVCRKSVEKRCGTERVGHMVSKKDDEGRILVVEEEKKKVAALADEMETMSAHAEKHTVKESSESVDEEALAAVRAGEDGSGV